MSGFCFLLCPYLAGGDTIEDLLACLEFAAESLRLKTQHLALA